MNLKDVKIDINTLTLGDVEDFEAAAGVSITQLGSGNLPVKALVALLFVVSRKTNPRLTIDEIRAIPMSELNSMAIVDSGTDPQ